MIVITFALPAESKALVSQLQNKQRTSFHGTDVISGEIGARPLMIFHTGVGRRVAERKLTQFLDHQTFELLISSGFAGGVDNELNVGDLFLAENVSDTRLLAIAQQKLANVRPSAGKLLTSSGIVDSAAQRMKLARSRGAAAIDMESDVIAQICAERGVPMLSLRVISDTQREPFPAPPAVLFDIERQKSPILGLAAYIIKRPSALGGLIRFSRQINHARENLTNALTTLIRNESFDSHGR